MPRGQARLKRFLLVFAFRCAHLEVLMNLDTAAALLAFEYFVREGISPKYTWTIGGTNEPYQLVRSCCISTIVISNSMSLLPCTEMVLSRESLVFSAMRAQLHVIKSDATVTDEKLERALEAVGRSLSNSPKSKQRTALHILSTEAIILWPFGSPRRPFHTRQPKRRFSIECTPLPPNLRKRSESVGLALHSPSSRLGKNAPRHWDEPD